MKRAPKPRKKDRAKRPAGPEHFARADWKKIVFALADYAYRGLAPDTTWDEARVMVRAAISVAFDAETEDWDPTEETLLKYVGGAMRDLVIVARDHRGTGDEAREERPDWALAARTIGTAEMRKRMTGEAGLPISNEEYFLARRRTRAHAIDVLRELPMTKARRRATPPEKLEGAEATWVVMMSSLDQDNFEDTMPRALLEEVIREQGGDPEGLWKRLGPWVETLLAERAKRVLGG